MKRRQRTTQGGLTVVTEVEYHPVVTRAYVSCPGSWLHWRHADMAIGDVICTPADHYWRVIHDGVWWGYEFASGVRIPIGQFYWRYPDGERHDAAHREPPQPPADPFVDLA